jgi:hypothetical protein
VYSGSIEIGRAVWKDDAVDTFRTGRSKEVQTFPWILYSFCACLQAERNKSLTGPSGRGVAKIPGKLMK